MKRAIPLLLLVFVVGCRTKLNDESSMTLNPGDIKSREIDAISGEQKVNISAKADSGEFDIYFFLAKDQTEVEKNPAKAGAKILDKKLKTGEATLSATVPANEKATVMLMPAGNKKAEVKLKIAN